MFNLVVALDRNRGIGHDGRLPWKLQGDTRFFRELTTCPDRIAVEQKYGFSPIVGAESPLPLEDWLSVLKSRPPLPRPVPDNRNAVIMGRNTWDSLPPEYKPLPNRLNEVLSRQPSQEGAGTHRIWQDLQEALSWLDKQESVKEIFIIGGAQIYAEALNSPKCSRIYLTEIDLVFPCDTFFPNIPPEFKEHSRTTSIVEDNIQYRFRHLQRIP